VNGDPVLGEDGNSSIVAHFADAHERLGEVVERVGLGCCGGELGGGKRLACRVLCVLPLAMLTSFVDGRRMGKPAWMRSVLQR
jgi:hypothetical protein